MKDWRGLTPALVVEAYRARVCGLKYELKASIALSLPQGLIAASRAVVVGVARGEEALLMPSMAVVV